MPSVGSGSNVQPSRSDAGRRGLDGAPARGRRRDRPGRRHATSATADRGRPPDHATSPAIGGMVARTGRAVVVTVAAIAGSSLRETHARRIEWSRFGPGSTAPALSSVVAPRPRRATILEDLDVELPKVALLPDRDLRSRRRCRDRRPEPHPAVLRRERARGRRRRFITGLYPPIAVTTQGAEIRNLYTVIFLIAVAIFVVVEGLIIWTVIRYRRKPGDDTSRRRPTATTSPSSCGRSSRRSSSSSCSSCRGRRSTRSTRRRPAPRPRSAPLAGQFQWQFDYLAQDGTTVLYTEYIPLSKDGGGMTVPAGRTVQLSLRQQGRHPRLLRPAVPVQARRRAGPDEPVRLHGQRVGRRPDVPRPVRRAVRRRPQHDAVRRPRPARRPSSTRGWPTRRSRTRRRPRAARPQRRGTERQPGASGAAPSGSPAASGAAPSGAPGAVVKISASGIAYEQSSITAPAGQPFKIEFENKDAGTPHNVSIHQGSASGDRGLQGRDLPRSRDQDLRRARARRPAAYTFACTVHPTMTGTLTVQ